MKTFLILFLAWGFTAGASSPKSFRVANFLEPLHPQSARDPNWPSSVTIEDVMLQSVSEFLKTRDGRWRVVYACNGKPVPYQYLAENNMSDGWVNSRSENQYEGRRWQGFNIIRPANGKPGDVNSTIQPRPIKTDSVKMVSPGAFEVKSDGDPVYMVRFGRIRETGELVFFSEELTNYEPCDGVNFLRALLVPVEVPVS